MYTTQLHKKRHHSNNLERDVEKILKKAMAATSNPSVAKKIKQILLNPILNAKLRTTLAQRKLANFAHKKPITSLGVTFLAGALISAILLRTFWKD